MRLTFSYGKILFLLVFVIPLTYGKTTQLAGKDALTLQGAWERVKAHNPALQAAAFSINAAVGQQIQAAVIPNPVFSYNLQQAPGTGDYQNYQMAESTFFVNEPVLLGGKRSARKEVANTKYLLSKNLFTANVAALFNLTAQSFLDVAQAETQLKLAQQTLMSNQQTVNTIQRRTEAGRSSQLELKAAQIALADQQLVEKSSLQMLASAQYNLAMLWGENSPASLPVIVAPLNQMALKPLSIYMKKISQNPEIKTFLQQEQVEEAQIRLAQANGVPDIIIGAGIQHFNQTHDISGTAQVAIPIPLFDRNQGNTASALATYDKALGETQYKTNQLKTAIFDTYLAAAQALLQINSFQTTILPNAQSAFKLAKQGYEQGRFSYLDLLSAQQKLANEQVRYVNACYGYRKSWVKLQVLTGGLPNY